MDTKKEKRYIYIYTLSTTHHSPTRGATPKIHSATPDFDSPSLVE